MIENERLQRALRARLKEEEAPRRVATLVARADAPGAVLGARHRGGRGPPGNGHGRDRALRRPSPRDVCCDVERAARPRSVSLPSGPPVRAGPAGRDRSRAGDGGAGEGRLLRRPAGELRPGGARGDDRSPTSTRARVPIGRENAAALSPLD